MHDSLNQRTDEPNKQLPTPKQYLEIMNRYLNTIEQLRHKPNHELSVQYIKKLKMISLPDLVAGQTGEQSDPQKSAETYYRLEALLQEIVAHFPELA